MILCVVVVLSWCCRLSEGEEFLPKRIVVAVSGASGAIYAQRTIELLVGAGVEVHLVVSVVGRRLMCDELGMSEIDLTKLAGRRDHGVRVYENDDLGAVIASGSFRHDGMVVVPCSNHTLASIGGGLCDNLLHRAAAVTLKERRLLVLCHRETPLSLIDIRNMASVTEAGGVIMPANPGFYMRPRSVGDMVDFVVGRLLDLIGVAHDLCIRWQGGE